MKDKDAAIPQLETGGRHEIRDVAADDAPNENAVCCSAATCITDAVYEPVRPPKFQEV